MIDEMIYCPKCGKEIEANSRFCTYCGEIVKTTAESSETIVDSAQNKEESEDNTSHINPIIDNQELNTNNGKSKASANTSDRGILPIIALIVVAFVIVVIVGYNIHNQPVKEAMGFVDELAELQYELAFETNTELFEVKYQLYQVKMLRLELLEKDLSPGQQKKVNTYMEEKLL